MCFNMMNFSWLMYLYLFVLLNQFLLTQADFDIDYGYENDDTTTFIMSSKIPESFSAEESTEELDDYGAKSITIETTTIPDMAVTEPASSFEAIDMSDSSDDKDEMKEEENSATTPVLTAIVSTRSEKMSSNTIVGSKQVTTTLARTSHGRYRLIIGVSIGALCAIMLLGASITIFIKRKNIPYRRYRTPVDVSLNEQSRYLTGSIV